MKRIVTVQDISCVGKCSLSVAMPIISAMGVEACVLPTAVLSTHTAFRGFTFRDLTADIKPMTEHWKAEKFRFDAIYTGYLGSFEQLELMHGLLADFGGPDTLKIVDPCMADNGSLYSGFTLDFAAAMKGLCSRADVIVPNMTEASLLLGVPYSEGGYGEAYVREMLLALAALGAGKVVLKGVVLPEQEGRLGVASYDAVSSEFSWYFHKRMPKSFHGTGDIFASVLTGALVRGVGFDKACQLAADFVVESIRLTLADVEHEEYGVEFERALPYLIRRMGDK